ncbi:MAG: hypothetical protein JO197_04055 [Acidobacteria bacterium]|nr:hypothetical protein [Acidobacteriota bacterium]MBV9476440.1 hypothetical protein [Acidobacteriota bacterium]
MSVLLALCMTACGTMRSTAIVRRGGVPNEHVEIARLAQQVDSELQYLPVAAAFSAAVYVDAPLTTPLAQFEPKTADERDAIALLPSSGWVERTDADLPRTKIAGKRQTPDLTYRLWVTTEGTPRVAMLVFRGTHIRADWISNLRWFDSWWYPTEDHYEQTERITGDLVQWIHAHYGNDAIIYTAGHSLGGGLAQTAAYTACGDIRSVFAFDSTPVTRHRAANGCGARRPREFWRVYEQSEILSYARFVVRVLLDLKVARPQITELKVHLFPGVGVRGHSMLKLATELKAKSAQTSVAARDALSAR